MICKDSYLLKAVLLANCHLIFFENLARVLAREQDPKADLAGECPRGRAEGWLCPQALCLVEEHNLQPPEVWVPGFQHASASAFSSVTWLKLCRSLGTMATHNEHLAWHSLGAPSFVTLGFGLGGGLGRKRQWHSSPGASSSLSKQEEGTWVVAASHQRYLEIFIGESNHYIIHHEERKREKD